MVVIWQYRRRVGRIWPEEFWAVVAMKAEELQFPTFPCVGPARVWWPEVRAMAGGGGRRLGQFHATLEPPSRRGQAGALTVGT
jgi:hypothetical protein